MQPVHGEAGDAGKGEGWKMVKSDLKTCKVGKIDLSFLNRIKIGVYKLG